METNFQDLLGHMFVLMLKWWLYGLLVNLLSSICMSEKVFCFLFWKIFLLGIVLQVERFFSFSTLRMPIHLFFGHACFWQEVCCHSYLFPQYGMCLFSLRLLIFSLSLEAVWLWCRLVYFSLCLFCCGLLSCLGLWVYNFHQILKNFSQFFKTLFFTLFPSRMLRTHILDQVMLSQQITDALFIFFFSHFLFHFG